MQELNSEIKPGVREILRQYVTEMEDTAPVIGTGKNQKSKVLLKATTWIDRGSKSHPHLTVIYCTEDIMRGLHLIIEKNKELSDVEKTYLLRDATEDSCVKKSVVGASGKHPNYQGIIKVIMNCQRSHCIIPP